MKKNNLLKKLTANAIAVTIIISTAFSNINPIYTEAANKKPFVDVNDYGILTSCNTKGTFHISKNISAISANAFDDAHITEFTVDNDNPLFKTVDGVLFTKDGKRLIRFPQEKSGTYTIPAGVKTISQYAFKKSRKLTEIVIPDSVSNIGEGAFYGCRSLTNITLPKKVTKIHPYTFYNCLSLKNIKLNSSIKRLGYKAFKKCKSLESLTIPKNITKIESETFKECENLKKVVLPSTLETIAYKAFSNCNSLNTIKLPNGLELIDDYAFYACNSLKSIKLPDNIDKIYDHTFADCKNLSSVYIGKNTTIIGYMAFSGCTSLKNITIPANVESISNTAFDNSIETFKVSSDSTKFSASNGILYNKNKTTIKKFPCLKSGNYKMPNTVKKIASNAFTNSESLKNITFSDNIAILYLDDFRNSGINTMHLPAKLEYVAGNSSYLKKLTTITIPETNKRFFTYDDVLYCYYDVQNYVSSNANSNWNSAANAANCSMLIYPTAKTGTVTLLEQTYSTNIPSENRASYFKTTSVTTGTAFYASDGGTLTDSKKTIIYEIPGKIKKISLGSKMKYIDTIYNNKKFLTDIKSYSVSSLNKYYTAKNGVLYNKHLTKLLDYPSQRTGSYAFPGTVISINQTAFKNAVKLKELKISKNIENNKTLSLINCNSLSKITIPEGSDLRKLTLYLNEKVTPKLISIPTSLISFKMHGISDKMGEVTSIQGFTNTCADKAAKTYKLKFISKGVVPKKVRKVKVKAYINERYVKISWAKASNVSGYEIYSDDNDTRYIKNNKTTSTNIYIGKNGSIILYIRAYNIVNGRKLYSKAKKLDIYLN